MLIKNICKYLVPLLTCFGTLLIVFGLELFPEECVQFDFDNDLFLARDPKFYNGSKYLNAW